MGRINTFKPYKVSTPIQLDVRFKNYRPAEVLSYLSDVKRTDAHSIRFQGKDAAEISRFLQFVSHYEQGLAPQRFAQVVTYELYKRDKSGRFVVQTNSAGHRYFIKHTTFPQMEFKGDKVVPKKGVSADKFEQNWIEKVD